MAQDVLNTVEDFTLHYRVTDTEDFLDKLLPVEKSTVGAILESMISRKLYNPKTKRWTNFPGPCRKMKYKKKVLGKENDGQGKSQEKSLYGPFCKIAEGIRAAAESLRGSSKSSMGSTKWVDYHSKSPASKDRRGAHSRPDGLFAFEGLVDHIERGQREEKAQAEVMNETETEQVERKANEDENGNGNVKGKGKENDIQPIIWWLQIIAVVDMKRSGTQNWLDVVKQLFGYLRRILREQLDRRFVFGLTLGPDRLTVWLHDRSGVIGTHTSIDIHEDPAKFIQVIAAFSLLPPEKLGFDPTIKLLVSPNQAVPSYEPNKEFIRAYNVEACKRRWVITMNDGLEYVTVETVSQVRGGFLRGRGSIAWVVVPYKRANEANEEGKLFVLKQSWHPCEVDSEGDLYELGDGRNCPYVGAIKLCEKVEISGQEDTTDTLIRQDLGACTVLGKRTTNERPGCNKEFTDPHMHVTCTDVGDISDVKAPGTEGPVAQVRTRVLLSTYGWLIKCFSTRRELLVVLRDAIRGHQHLYKNGVLHRDISPGNILIKWEPGSEVDKPSTSGCLIDLDHAKMGIATDENASEDIPMDPVDDENTSEDIPMDDETLDVYKNILRRFVKADVDKEVIRLSLGCFPQLADGIVRYVSAVVEHASTFRGNVSTWTPRDLQWESGERSNFQRQKGSRTGTLPYTSGEFQSGLSYFSRPGSVFHDAVHDLESFFWVLVHICLTRKGPGGLRRKELEDEDNSELHRILYCFFDSDDNTMAVNKRTLFMIVPHFKQYLASNFHSYFAPLEKLVEEWFHLLRLAHQFHGFEFRDIHDMVLDIFDRALESLAEEDIDEDAQKVLNERKANIETLSENPFGTVQDPPPPQASPSSHKHGALADRHSPPSSPAPKRATKKVKKGKK